MAEEKALRGRKDTGPGCGLPAHSASVAQHRSPAHSCWSAWPALPGRSCSNEDYGSSSEGTVKEDQERTESHEGPFPFPTLPLLLV